MRSYFGFVGFFLLSLSPLNFNAVAQQEIENAPAAFEYQNDQAVFVDFRDVALDLVFDVAAQKTTGHALIQFYAPTSGFPILDMVNMPKRMSIDGVEIDVADAVTTRDPDNVTSFVVIKHHVEANQIHVIDLDYELKNGVDYTSTTVSAGFFMSDLTTGGRHFWERYAPSNYEYDQFNQIMNVSVVNTSKSHKPYTNGIVADLGDNQWNIQFPWYFTTSSFYFHLTTDTRFVEKTDVFQGMEKEIPIMVYADSSSRASQGLASAKKVLAENEATFGPYAHAKALAYVTPSGGGMEYGGATMTSLGALQHEFTHFWFARGVMPANGNAGWIDEAIASWRDNGYPRASSGPSGSPRNLGGFSDYRRHTTTDAYTKGAQLISEFDRQFSSFEMDGTTGMRAILGLLFKERRRTTIKVGFFKDFLERTTGADLTRTFERFVYGRSVDEAGVLSVAPESMPIFSFGTPTKGNHPRPYTAAELELYR